MTLLQEEARHVGETRDATGVARLVVQIPCYNEAGTIAETLRDIPRVIEGVGHVEVLILDDGSTDGTADIARAAGADHVVRMGANRGLAQAFRAALEASLRLGADIVVNTDGDNQYRGSDIPRLIRPILRGEADMVVGARHFASQAHFSRVKRFLQTLGSRVVSRAAGLEMPDATSGFRAYSRDAALRTNVYSRFTYTLETLIQAGAAGLVVASVPIATNPPRRPSRLFRSPLGYVRRSIPTILRIALLYRPVRYFASLGALMFAVGFLLGLRYAWFYYFGENAIRHIESLIFAVVCMVTGVQAVSFGVLADLLTAHRRMSEEIVARLRRDDLRSPGFSAGTPFDLPPGP